MSSGSLYQQNEQGPKVANSLKILKKSAHGKTLNSLKTEESEGFAEDANLRSSARPPFITSPSNLQQSPHLKPPMNYYFSGQQTKLGNLARTQSMSSINYNTAGQPSTSIISPAIFNKSQIEQGNQASNQIFQGQPQNRAQIMKSSMAQSQITTVNKEISYETQAVKMTNYVQVPVYEAQYMEVKEETLFVGINVELLRLKLLIQEKDLELEVFRAKAAEGPHESKPVVVQILEGSGEDSSDLKIKNQQLVLEINMLKQEIELYKEKMKDMNDRFSGLNEKLNEKDGLLEHERERAKKAGAPKGPPVGGLVEGPIIDSGLLKELEEKIGALENELLGKDKLIEELMIQKSQVVQEVNDLQQKLKLSEQQKQNIFKGQQSLLDELNQLKNLSELSKKLQDEKKNLLISLDEKNQALEGMELVKKKSLDLEKQNHDLINENDSLKKQIAGILKELESKKGRFDQLEKELQTSRNKLKESEGNISQLIQEKETSEDEKKSLLAKISNLTIEFEGKIKGILIEKEGLAKRK